jgi:hypothetical protein
MKEGEYGQGTLYTYIKREKWNLLRLF